MTVTASIDLSGLQQAMLRTLIAAYVQVLTHGTAADRLAVRAQGMAWRSGGGTPARRVCISRALARLERRGIVVRIRPAGRTVAVRLTAAWADAVERRIARGAIVSRSARYPPAG
jgi:hypothetical protein